jgi:hypothetical protein
MKLTGKWRKTMKNKTGKYVVAGLFVILVLISGCTQQEDAPGEVSPAEETKPESSLPEVNPAEDKKPDNQPVTEVKEPSNQPVKEAYLFSWNDIPENDSELIDYLEGELKISWVKNAKIMKSGDGKTITVIRPEDIESITINNKVFGSDFVAVDGTYMFKIDGPEFSNYLTFNLDDVPGKHSRRILKFLDNNLKIDWVKNAEISKSTDGKTIILTNNENSLMLKINNEENKTILEINGVKTYEYVSKKETIEPYEYVSKKENDELNIYLPREQRPRCVGAIISVKLPNGTEARVYAVESLDDYWGTWAQKMNNYQEVEIGISDTIVGNIGIYVSDASVTIKDIPATADATADIKVYDMQGENAILFKLSEDKDKAILKIGGKVIHEYNVKNETGKLSIYD